MGLNTPNFKYFCLYCNCQSDIRWDMNQNHKNSGNNACKIFLFYSLLLIA